MQPASLSASLSISLSLHLLSSSFFHSFSSSFSFSVSFLSLPLSLSLFLCSDTDAGLMYVRSARLLLPETYLAVFLRSYTDFSPIGVD